MSLFVVVIYLYYVQQKLEQNPNQTSFYCGTPDIDPNNDVLLVLNSDETKGREIFMNNCSPCHTISNEILVGPGLHGLFERRDLKWIKKKIRNSNKLIKNGEVYSLKQYQKFNYTEMPSFESLNKNDFDSLISYLKRL